MQIIKFLKNKKFQFKKSTNLFGLLIISTIVIHLVGWALDWKYGNSFLQRSEKLITFSALFSPETDGGYFEHFQYIITIWCSILSFIWIYSKKIWEAFSIPLIYFYLFLDDSQLFQGRAHNIIPDKISINQNLLNDHLPKLTGFSDVLYWLLVVIVILFISSPGIFSTDSETRRFIYKNYIYFLLLGFFGVILDFFIANWIELDLIESNKFAFYIRFVLLVSEEIGEIIVTSFACIWLFNLNYSK